MLAGRRLAARWQVDRIGVRRGRVGPRPGRQIGRGLDRGGRGQHGSPRRLRPRAVERREHRVHLLARRRHLAGLHDGAARVHVQVHTVRGEGLAQPRLATLREPAHVGAHVHRAGARFRDDVERARDHVALAHHQVRAASHERAVEIDQALQQEAAPVRAAPQQIGVEHEEGHDGAARPHRGIEGRMVVQAEIPREQHDRPIRPP